MKELRIEGYPCSISRAPEPEGDPFEMAHELISETLSMLDDLPGTSMVVLSEATFEEYTPPRCRIPRRRIVTTPIMHWTLEEFLSAQSGSPSGSAA